MKHPAAPAFFHSFPVNVCGDWGRCVERSCVCCVSLAGLLIAVVLVPASAWSVRGFIKWVPMAWTSEPWSLEATGGGGSRFQSYPAGSNASTAPLWAQCQGQQHLQFEKALPVCLRVNLNYIRIPKTASSTVEKIMWRIAARYGLYGAEKLVCADSPSCLPKWEPFLLAKHGRAQGKDQDLKKNVSPKLPMIYFTFVRDPVERLISSYYYFVVRPKNISASPTGFLKYLRKSGGTYESNYIRRRRDNHSQTDASPYEILDDYDFVGVTERMDESMLLLRRKLGLPSLCDVLYANYKRSERIKRPGSHLSPELDTNMIRHYLASAAFRDKMAPDLQLHAAANARIDHMIDQIGIKEFQNELFVFQKLLGKAAAKCGRAPGCRGGSGHCCLDNLCVDDR